MTYLFYVVFFVLAVCAIVSAIKTMSVCDNFIFYLQQAQVIDRLKAEKELETESKIEKGTAENDD